MSRVSQQLLTLSRWFLAVALVLAIPLPNAIGTEQQSTGTTGCATDAGDAEAQPSRGQLLTEIEFNRDIRPVLSEHCFRCHGPDSAARKADLRLDQREAAIEAGAIGPGDPNHSELVRRIFSTDAETVMPPVVTQKQLSQREKLLLRRWIAEGAEYQPHWSLIPLRKPLLPAVENTAWIRNPIDRFVLERLEQNGLQPAPPADRRTLIRRLSLDLTGLPPVPAEVKSFIEDTDSRAWDNLVDQYLRSPHWGEHRARYWLDAARYADTHGLHFDNYREMWTWRDWVINAFNRNLPFDQFTIEQLAGDLLPNRTLEQQIASGFNRCNVTSAEAGSVRDELLVMYTRDRTVTTAQVWLGMTANCAVCHDHKFDDLTQREFYEMAAFFGNTTQAAMDLNLSDPLPTIFIPQPSERDRWESLVRLQRELMRKRDARRQSARSEFTKWLRTADRQSFSYAPFTEELQFHAPLAEGAGGAIRYSINGESHSLTSAGILRWEQGHVSPQAVSITRSARLEFPRAGDFERDEPFSIGVWIRPSSINHIGTLMSRLDGGQAGWRVSLDVYNRVSVRISNSAGNRIQLQAHHRMLPSNEWTHVTVTCDGSGTAAGVKIYINGVAETTQVQGNNLTGSIRTNAPLKIGEPDSQLNRLAVQDLRIWNQALFAQHVRQQVLVTRAMNLIGQPVDQRSAEETEEIYDAWLTALDDAYRQLNRELIEVEQARTNAESRGAVAHVMEERSGTPTAHVLFRGEYDKRRERVTADTPNSMPPLPPEFPQNRLGFARWLMLPQHPLTARVAVNRFWQQVFGNGIVSSSGDFGVSGDLPSHPELLDWLAVEFRASGWDVRELFRLIVTSSTWRQAATVSPDKLRTDPENRLLSRGPRFRMDAEMLRDYALASSGLLVRKIGGASVKPYQPDGVWEAVALLGSNTRFYRQGSGENLYRRSLYTFWKRSAPPASMEIFNAPSREFCTTVRERTNTPLQALVMLNDPQFLEAACYLAQSALLEAGSTANEKLTFIAERVLIRPLRSEENDVVTVSLATLLDYYQSHPDDAMALLSVGESSADASLDPPTLAAWTVLTSQLMNLDEVLKK